MDLLDMSEPLGVFCLWCVKVHAARGFDLSRAVKNHNISSLLCLSYGKMSYANNIEKGEAEPIVLTEPYKFLAW